MTEHEWLQSTHPWPMVNFAFQHYYCKERLWRLYSVACCQRIFHLLSDERSKAAVEAAERHAEACGSTEEDRTMVEMVRAAEQAAQAVRDSRWTVRGAANAALAACYTAAGMDNPEEYPPNSASGYAAWAVAEAAGTVWRSDAWETAAAAEFAVHCDILRDLVRCRRLFRRSSDVLWYPGWRTPTVSVLGQAIYAERRFSDLPILADALEEAGCTSADILDHCRSGGEHVRGCWALDLVFGRE